MTERIFQITELETPIEGFYTRARDGPWWANVHAYAEEMKSGAKFPPIQVGELDGHLIVVDGYHRIEATKKLKIDYIKGTLKKYSSKAQLLKAAVEANNHHGVRYTPQDKAHIAKLLAENGFKDQEIASIVGIPLEKLTNFTMRNFNGKTLKAPLARFVQQGKLTQAEAAEVDQSRLSTMTIDDVIIQLINYLEFGVYPWGEAKYQSYAQQIVNLIQPHLKEIQP